MDAFPKLVLAVTTITSVVLCIVAGRQAGRIARLERDVHPERYAITRKAGSSKTIPSGCEAEAQAVVLAKMGGLPQEELIGETHLKFQVGAWDKGFSRDEETEIAKHLCSLGVGKFHNFGVSYGSDGNILVRGTAPVVEIKRVAYEIRPDASRKGVWNVYRVQWTPSIGSAGTLNPS
jgi:hypothetical protein